MEKPYDWMIQHTPQREWIEGKGLLLLLAFFFIELGGALFIVALFFKSKLGLGLGWFITALLGGGFHFFYLGNPLRFWRAVLRPQTSWISRGLISVTLFFIFGIIILITGLEKPSWFITIAGISAFLVVVYGGFVMSFVTAIPLWNSGLIPVLYLIGSLLGGSEIMMVLFLNSGNAAQAQIAEHWIQILLPSYALVIMIYFWATTYTSAAGKQSISDILKGKLSVPFYLLVVLIGILIPMAVEMMVLSVGFSGVPLYLLFLAVLCGLLGDLAMRYCILKGALYAPLVSKGAY